MRGRAALTRDNRSLLFLLAVCVALGIYVQPATAAGKAKKTGDEGPLCVNSAKSDDEDDDNSGGGGGLLGGVL